MEPDNVPTDEVKKLVNTAMNDNVDVMNALAEYDKRETVDKTAYLAEQNPVIRGATGTNRLIYNATVHVIEASITHNLETGVAKAE